MSASNLLIEVRKLYQSGKYEEALMLLPDLELENFGDEKLWIEKAFCLYQERKWEPAVAAFKKALNLGYKYPMQSGSVNLDTAGKSEYITLLGSLVKSRNAEADLTIINAGKNNDSNLYSLANEFFKKQNYSRSLEIYQEVLKSHPDDKEALFNIASLHFTLKEYDSAIKFYSKLLTTTSAPKLLAKIYYNLGLMSFEQNHITDAKDHYLQSIKLDPQSHRYHNLGLTYQRLKDYPNAIESYKEAIKLEPGQPRALYNLGLLYSDQKNYEEAKKTLISFLDSSADKDDYFVSNAYEKLREITKIEGNQNYREITELVNDIKQILLFDEQYVTHYTSLFVTKILILGTDKRHNGGSESDFLRLSEGVFLNDPSEGNVLFDHFASFPNVLHEQAESTNPGKIKIFTRKPFIGSFVPKSKQNDLALWRMYGKDNKDEAKGCSLTMNRQSLLEAIADNLKSKTPTESSEVSLDPISEIESRSNPINPVMEENFSFYRVAYLTSKDSQFKVPGFEMAIGSNEKLNQKMGLLKSNVDRYLRISEEDYKAIQDLRELLNEIAYLFKTEEYYYEHEIRLVVKGVGFEKVVDQAFDPPRVYINLAKVNPLIQQLTLGPKVEHASEYAASFYYHLTNEKLTPEIYISQIPFK